MKKQQKSIHWLRISLLAVLCITLIGVIPPSSTEAMLVDEPMDNDRDEFGQGVYHRTGLFQQNVAYSSLNNGSLRQINRNPNTDPEEDKFLGMVKLARSGEVGDFVTSFDLPEPLSHMGVATIGRRIYLFGGLVEDGGVRTFTSKVWSTEIQDDSANRNDRAPSGTAFDSWRPEGPAHTFSLFSSAAGELPHAVSLRSTSLNVIRGPHYEIQNMMVASYDNPDPNENDYIYLMGGEARDGTNSFTSAAVRIATVDSQTGEITDWTTSDDVLLNSRTNNRYPMMIPSHTWDGVGNDDASIVEDQKGLKLAGSTVAVVDDVPYLYLIGGSYEIPSAFSGSGRGAIPNIFYARIGSDGRLYRPGTTGTADADIGWARMLDGSNNPIDLQPNAGDGVVDPLLVLGETNEGDQVIYMIGGYNQETDVEPVPNGEIHRATFNSDGTLNPSTGDFTVDYNIYGHGGAEVNSSIFLTGGLSGGGSPAIDVASLGYIEDNLDLHNYDESGGELYFIHKDLSEPDQPLPVGLAHHGSAVVDFDGVSFLYALGGTDESSELSSEVYFIQASNTGAQEEQPYAESGWFTSRMYSSAFNAPRIEKIKWYMGIETFPTDEDNLAPVAIQDSFRDGVDIKMQYRYKKDSDPSCTEDGDPNAVNWDTGWVDLVAEDNTTGFNSKLGENVFEAPDEAGQDKPPFTRCFQYRALLTAGSSGDSNNESPVLMRVDLVIDTPRSADLFIQTLEPLWAQGVEGYYGGMDIILRNLYAPAPQDTLPVWAQSDQKGYFSVDLFIFGPGFSSGSMTDPETDLQNAMPYKDDIIMGVMPIATAGTSSFPPGSNAVMQASDGQPVDAGDATRLDYWCDMEPLAAGGNTCEPIPLGDLFNDSPSGEYTVCVAVDGYIGNSTTSDDEQYGYVHETLGEGTVADAEKNNVECTTFTLTIAPNVSLQVPDDNVIDEGNFKDFTIQLDRNAGQALSLPLTLSGTADRPADYEVYFVENGQKGAKLGSGSTINVPVASGTDSVTLRVEALEDSGTDSKFETVNLSLGEDSTGLQYNLENPSSGTFLIKDPDAAWTPPVVKLMPPSNGNDVTSTKVASFSIERTMPDGSDIYMPVPFNLSSAAAYGADYLIYDAATNKPISSNNLILLEGNQSATYELRLVDGATAQDELVTISLKESADEFYTLGSPATVSFVLNGPSRPQPGEETGPVYLPVVRR